MRVREKEKERWGTRRVPETLRLESDNPNVSLVSVYDQTLSFSSVCVAPWLFMKLRGASGTIPLLKPV